MKKIAAFFLCALMVMSLSLPTFALTPDVTGTEPVSPHSVTDDHIWSVYNATCDGYWQTWYLKCTHSGCSERTTTTKVCPGRAMARPAAGFLPELTNLSEYDILYSDKSLN